MACKQITLSGDNGNIVTPCITFPELLFCLAVKANVDPSAHSLIYQTPGLEFKITSKNFPSLIKELPEITLKVVRKASDRLGFLMIFKYFRQHELEMHKSVKVLFKKYLIADTADLLQIELTEKMLIGTYRHLLMILPFMNYTKEIHLGTSTMAKYSDSFMRLENISERCSSSQSRLDLLGLTLNSSGFPISNLIEVISLLNNLEFIDFSFSNFGNSAKIMDFTRFPQLKGVNLTGCHSLDFCSIFKNLGKCKNLEILEVNDCGLMKNHLETLHMLTSIGELIGLKAFSIKNNPYCAGPELNYCISAMNNLERLDITNCGYYRKILIDLTYTGVALINLQRLYISRVDLCMLINEFTYMLHYLSKLTHLDVSNNRLADPMVIKILQSTKNLKLLDITENYCSEAILNFFPMTIAFFYATFLTDIRLPQANTFIELEINFQNHSTGLKLLTSLQGQTSLKNFGLKKLQIVLESASILCELLKFSPNLNILDLHDAVCSAELSRKISESVSKSKSLTLFGFSHAIPQETLHVISRIQSGNRHFRISDNYAVLKKSDLLKHKPKCKLCFRYCIFPDICEWIRKRGFLYSRLKNNIRLV